MATASVVRPLFANTLPALLIGAHVAPLSVDRYSVRLVPQITPVRLSGQARPRYRHRLIVDEARLYPGAVPRRVRLVRMQQDYLRATDVARLLPQAADTIAELRRRRDERIPPRTGILLGDRRRRGRVLRASGRNDTTRGEVTRFDIGRLR